VQVRPHHTCLAVAVSYLRCPSAIPSSVLKAIDLGRVESLGVKDSKEHQPLVVPLHAMPPAVARHGA
jgi:hypothetical protein